MLLCRCYIAVHICTCYYIGMAVVYKTAGPVTYLYISIGDAVTW